MVSKTLLLTALGGFALYKLLESSSASAQAPVLGPSPGNTPYVPPSAPTSNPATGATFNVANGAYNYTLRDGRTVSGPEYNTMIKSALASGQTVYTKMPNGIYRQWLKILPNGSEWRDLTTAQYTQILRRSM